jgi:hypothetical protein
MPDTLPRPICRVPSLIPGTVEFQECGREARYRVLWPEKDGDTKLTHVCDIHVRPYQEKPAFRDLATVIPL